MPVCEVILHTDSLHVQAKRTRNELRDNPTSFIAADRTATEHNDARFCVIIYKDRRIQKHKSVRLWIIIAQSKAI